MNRKGIKVILIITIAFFLLVGLSLSISKYRLNKYTNTVVNDEIIEYKNLDYLLNKTSETVVYIFLYDNDNDDCVYLDEVLLKEISNHHNGIKFEDIYKVVYEQSYRSYIQQIIKNTYDINSFPAIVALEKTENGFNTKDKFEYTSNQTDNIENLEKFLNRNHFFDINQKD